MTKFKIKNSVWNVLGEGLKIYFTNFLQFSKYMLFPVFGQIIGIMLIFAAVNWFTSSLPIIVEEHPLFNNFTTISLTTLLITVPGFVIFLKAFWDYLVAYGALNSMTEAVITTGKLYDLNAHTEVITKRSVKFIALLFVISIMSFIGINPLFWVIGLIFFVYFILIFQVFTFEENLSVIDCFKRSFYLIKGNFARTFLIMAILWVISYYLLTQCVSYISEVIKLSELLKGIFENWASSLPLPEINTTLNSFRIPSITPLEIANQILDSLILCTVAGLTLPMRSVCWTLWYKNLKDVNDTKSNKKGK